MMVARVFLKVDLPSWIERTIEKVGGSETWKDAWVRTYFELGGRSSETAHKHCPMAAAEALYRLGHIVGHGAVRRMALTQVERDYSKNGAYAVAAIACLQQDLTLDLGRLWHAVRHQFRLETSREPAQSNQGGATIAYKLWHLNMLQ